ncbi:MULTISPECIES: diguanylate cyclase [Thalassospira]|uniref:sensor domain-containing diguanylate cyclase n=1 Tax=Thalassospira TaxID=168934 RepID=UPI0008DDB4A7|nr:MULTISPECIES: diguanylate cyclase [Thalassospira]MAB34981.1 GGDEF domain-containing protein [Thalassospira sp.]MDM7976475.1 diguanylate cyclase [Thalassospira xiamenensis]OHY97295.1 diguanylate cyclase [Thalassospira sp. MIT1004]HBS25475.1 GGDEF domain-containing protein [Thalassospira sp.]|tara:strand:+ start:1146 stop:2780 length:1635 start_codon:yes stop_codon:yes gene_type:complete
MRFEPTEIARLYGRSRVGVVVHRDLNAVYVNDAYAKMLGRKDVKDFMAEPDLRQYIPPSFHYEASKLVAKFQDSTGFHGWKKVYNIRTDGTPVWMEISDETVEWGDDNAVLTTAQLIDNGTTAMQVDHMLGRSFIGVMVHRDMTALYVNDAFARLMGAENASAFMEKPDILRFIPEADRDRAIKHVADILHGAREGERHRVRDILDDGSTVWRDLTDERILWHDGRPAILTTAHDVREEVEMNEALMRTKAGLEEAVTEVIRMVPSAVAMLDVYQNVTNFNREFARLFGEEQQNKDDDPVFDISILCNLYASMIKGGHGHANVDSVETPSGSHADIRMNLMEDGRVMVSALDISSHKRKEQHLDALASTDPLTGALNRRGFESAVSRLREIRLLKGKVWQFGLVVLDLDYFKYVNDTYGHSVGDRVLEKIAITLRQALRDDDLVVRLGGEEFAVLLPSATTAVTKRIAERLANMIRAIEIPVGASGNEMVTITASFGVTVGGELRGQFVELEQALLVADRAMYDAKEAGRDTIRFLTFDDDIDN